MILRSYRDAYTGLTRDVWTLSMAMFANRAGTMVFTFLTLYLTQERGLSIEMAGRVVGTYGLGGILGSYLGGWLSDRLGSVRTQQLTLAANGVTLLVLESRRELGEIVLAVLLFSIFDHAFRPAAMASVGERAPREVLARSYALIRLTANLGMGLGSTIGGFLALHSYRSLFLVDALSCWLGAGLLLLLTPSRRDPNFDAEALSGEQARVPGRDRPFLMLMVLAAVSCTILYQVFSTFPIFLRTELALRENSIGAVYAINSLLIAVFEMLLIHSLRTRDRMTVTAIGITVMSLGFALTALATSFWLVATSMAVLTLGEMLWLPLLNTIVADRASSAHRGRYMGWYMMAASVAEVAAPVLGTIVYQSYGSLVLWLGIGVLGGLLSAALLGLKKFF